MKQKINVYFIVIMYSLLLLFPIKAYDCFTEYDRLRLRYPKMRPEVFALIWEYGKTQNNLTPDQVCAVIQEESNWDQFAVSRSFARGYMQIMWFHHKGNPLDLFNPELNIYYGCRYLRWCLNHAKGDLSLAMKYYNAGPLRPEKADQRYVRAIIAHNKITNKFISNYDKEIQ